MLTATRFVESKPESVKSKAIIHRKESQQYR